jgi:hypothetical protein
MRTIQDAHFQLKTALAFIEMTGNDKSYSEKERKTFFRVAFMHAKVGATIAHCLGDVALSFYADGVASDCAYALDALLEGADVSGGRMAYLYASSSRVMNDALLGIDMKKPTLE